MARALFQVLVFPYFVSDAAVSYALFRRNKNAGGYWQAIAGGGENGETPLEAAKRESAEEAGIDVTAEYFQLSSIATIPWVKISKHEIPDGGPLVLPEHTFGVRVSNKKLSISDEHDSFNWCPYSKARQLLRWDSNKNALWELDYRINNNLLR